MPLPPIQLQMVAGGTDKVLASLKTIEQAVAQHEASIVKLRKTSADQQKKIHDDLTAHLKKNGGLGGTTLVDEEKKNTDRLASEMRRRSHLLSSIMRGLGLGGFSRDMRVGSAMSGGEMSGMLAGGAAIGVAAAAVMAIKKVFDILESGVEKVVGDFTSAILEIGGGFSVATAMVEAAKRERLGNQVRMSALNPNERMSRSELEYFASQQAGNASLGGFSSEDWMKAVGKYTALTGKQASFAGLGDFAGKIAHTTGMTPEQVAGMMGTISAQNPSMNNDQIQNLILRGRGIAAHGSFNLNEITNMGQLTRNAANIKGDWAENAAKLMGIAALIKPNVGGTVEEASTATNAFIREMKVVGRKGTGKQFGIEFDKQGNLTDLGGAIGNIMGNYMTKGISGVPKELQTRESGAFLDAFKTQIVGELKSEGIDPAVASFQQVKQAADALLTSYSGASSTIEQLNRDNEESISVQDRLQAAFNSMKDDIGTRLLPIIADFADMLEEHGDQLVDILGDLYEIVADLAPAFVTLMQVIVKMASAIFAGVTLINPLLMASTTWQRLGAGIGKLEQDVSSLSEVRTKEERDQHRIDRQYEGYLSMDPTGRNRLKGRLEKELGIGGLWNPLSEDEMTDEQRRKLKLLNRINGTEPAKPESATVDVQRDLTPSEQSHLDTIDKAMGYTTPEAKKAAADKSAAEAAEKQKNAADKQEEASKRMLEAANLLVSSGGGGGPTPPNRTGTPIGK